MEAVEVFDGLEAFILATSKTSINIPNNITKIILPHQYIGESGSRILAKALIQNSSVTELEGSFMRLSEEIADLLQREQLTTLTWHTSLNEKLFFSALISNQSLTCLSLNGCVLREYGLLAEAISAKNLKTLRLDNVLFGDVMPASRILSKAIMTISSLTKLSLIHCPILNNVGYYEKMNEVHPHLTYLDISRGGPRFTENSHQYFLTFAELEHLLLSLIENKTIRTLKMPLTTGTTRHAELLSEVFERNTILQKLVPDFDCIDREILIAEVQPPLELAANFWNLLRKKMPQKTFLNSNGNTYDTIRSPMDMLSSQRATIAYVRESSRFETSLANSKTLKTLEVLQNSSFLKLITGIRLNKSLDTLILREIEWDSWAHLATILAENDSLTSLTMPYPHGHKISLALAFELNKSVTRLTIHHEKNMKFYSRVIFYLRRNRQAQREAYLSMIVLLGNIAKSNEIFGMVPAEIWIEVFCGMRFPGVQHDWASISAHIIRKYR